MRLQDATLQQYLVDYQNTVLKAQKEVEDGISSFVQSRAVVAFPRKSVDAAKGALKIATKSARHQRFHGRAACGAESSTGGK